MRDGDESDALAVLDVNEYKQRRRLERILDAIDEVEDRAEHAYVLRAEGEIQTAGRNIEILHANKFLVRVAYGLLSGAVKDSEPADEWTGEGARANESIGAIPTEHPNSEPPAEFGSLREFLNADEIYIERWVEQRRTQYDGTVVQRQQARHTVPPSVSWTANEWVKDYLIREHDLEVQFEDLEQSMQTYSYLEDDTLSGVDIGFDEDADPGGKPDGWDGGTEEGENAA